MLAWRARRKVQAHAPTEGRPLHSNARWSRHSSPPRGRGDFDGLLRVLDPDMTWRIHAARGLVVRSGAEDVAARVYVGDQTATARRVLVNGTPGIAVWHPDGTLRAVMACTVVDGRIVEMESVTDPDRLASIGLPRSRRGQLTRAVTGPRRSPSVH